MSLQLQEYVFQIMEHQCLLYDYLGPHNWFYDLEQGHITFTKEGTGQELLRCNIQLIGSESREENTWLWAWANRDAEIEPKLLRGILKVKREGEKSQQLLFSTADEFPMRNEWFGVEMSIIAAGFLNHFTYYACSYDGGCLYTSIEQCDIISQQACPISKIPRIINTAISTLAFDHILALEAYLGQPLKIRKDRRTWKIGSSQLDVIFDHAGRISQLEHD